MSKVQTSFVPQTSPERGSYTSSSPETEAPDAVTTPRQNREVRVYRLVEEIIQIRPIQPFKLPPLFRGETVELRNPEACYLCPPEGLEQRIIEGLQEYLRENPIDESGE